MDYQTFISEVRILTRDLPEDEDKARFFRDIELWIGQGGSIDGIMPLVSDWRKQAGDTCSHYFHQDMLVARYIFEHGPTRHVDVGSRIDGFVAHVAAFRDIEVFDIRPLANTIPHIEFRQFDLTQRSDDYDGYCDSLSCLHAIEHFGLGRYGDAIDPQGHLHAFVNIARILKPGGRLYISFPIGAERILFNAHRIFDPMDIFSWPGIVGFELQGFDCIDDQFTLHRDRSPDDAALRQLEYGCGIYTFRKLD